MHFIRAKPLIGFSSKHVRHALVSAIAVFAVLFAGACRQKQPDETKVVLKSLASDDFKGNLDQWVVEQEPGGSVTTKDGFLVISGQGGSTVWLRQKLSAPVIISYDATFGDGARLSDLNCFWMASDPGHSGDLFASSKERGGKFSNYNSLALYYVGYGGNDNTTVRFRRYDGAGAKPLLPEFDLRDAAHLLKPNHIYRITLVAQEGMARFICDGKEVFNYKDAKPLTTGWFGFRTINTTLMIRNFRVSTPQVVEVKAKAPTPEKSEEKK